MLPRRMIEHRHETQIARHPAILRMRIICTGWLPLDWKPPLDSRCAWRCGLMKPSWTPSFRMKMQNICFLSRYFLFSTVFFSFFRYTGNPTKKQGHQWYCTVFLAEAGCFYDQYWQKTAYEPIFQWNQSHSMLESSPLDTKSLWQKKVSYRWETILTWNQPYVILQQSSLETDFLPFLFFRRNNVEGYV